MRKVVVFIEIITLAILFQNCKSTTEQEVLDSNTIENVVQQKVETPENVVSTEIKEDNSLVTNNNEVPTKVNEVKPVVNTPPKTIVPKTKAVKTIVETPVAIIKDVPTPKEVVIVKEPEPKPEPKPGPKPVVETPKSVPIASNWVVPAKYKTLKNPTNTSDSEGLNEGKALYVKHCKSCHGVKGAGDGTKTPEIETPMPDFLKGPFQAQTDGEIFFKTKEGRDDMPGFGKKITDDEEIWLMVNYLRTFKK